MDECYCCWRSKDLQSRTWTSRSAMVFGFCHPSCLLRLGVCQPACSALSVWASFEVCKQQVTITTLRQGFEAYQLLSDLGFANQHLNLLEFGAWGLPPCYVSVPQSLGFRVCKPWSAFGFGVDTLGFVNECFLF